MPTRLNIYGQGISTTKKKPCIVATTENIALSGATTPTTIDGVSLSIDNRILVWQQNSPQENGIYKLITSQLLARDYDFNINEDLYAGIEVLILSGLTYSGKTFYLTTSGNITIGSSSLSFNVLAGQNGTSGSSGGTGSSGASGSSGTSGTDGTSATSGSSGTSGTSGTSATSGSSGTSATSGSSGTSGATGASGSSGTSGSNAGITSYTNPADNRVITSVSSTAINAESNLVFDGTNLGIGTASPTFKLDVSGTGRFITSQSDISGIRGVLNVTNNISGNVINAVLPAGTSADAMFYRAQTPGVGADNQYFFVGQTGNGSAINTNKVLITTNGAATFSSTVTCTSLIETSSIKIKENIINLSNALEDVKKLRGVEYNKKGNDVKEIGLIAEEVDKILPEVVSKDEDGNPTAVSYSRLTALLIEAIKEQDNKIEILSNKINELYDRM